MHCNAPQVRAVLDVESARAADEVGSSTRRNQFPISPTTFHKIVKEDLHLHPFRYIVSRNVIASQLMYLK
jgi:hypothetical protein